MIRAGLILGPDELSVESWICKLVLCVFSQTRSVSVQLWQGIGPEQPDRCSQLFEESQCLFFFAVRLDKRLNVLRDIDAQAMTTGTWCADTRWTVNKSNTHKERRISTHRTRIRVVRLTNCSVEKGDKKQASSGIKCFASATKQQLCDKDSKTSLRLKLFLLVTKSWLGNSVRCYGNQNVLLWQYFCQFGSKEAQSDPFVLEAPFFLTLVFWHLFEHWTIRMTLGHLSAIYLGWSTRYETIFWGFSIASLVFDLNLLNGVSGKQYPFMHNTGLYNETDRSLFEHQYELTFCFWKDNKPSRSPFVMRIYLQARGWQMKSGPVSLQNVIWMQQTCLPVCVHARPWCEDSVMLTFTLLLLLCPFWKTFLDLRFWQRTNCLMSVLCDEYVAPTMRWKPNICVWEHGKFRSSYLCITLVQIPTQTRRYRARFMAQRHFGNTEVMPWDVARGNGCLHWLSSRQVDRLSVDLQSRNTENVKLISDTTVVN